MQLWQVLVPTTKNDSVPGKNRFYSIRLHRIWDERVRALSGGLTIFPVVKGQWVDKTEGVLYNERMIPVNIMCDQSMIEAIVKMTAKHYQQLAVFYYKISEECFIYYAENQK